MLGRDIEPATTRSERRPAVVYHDPRPGQSSRLEGRCAELSSAVSPRERAVVRRRGRPGKARPDSVQRLATWRSPRTDGWQYLGEQGFLIIHLPGPGPHSLEIPGAKPRAGSLLPSQLTAIAFDFAAGLEGWTPVSEIENLRVEDGRLKGLATGPNPYLHRTRLRVNGPRQRQAQGPILIGHRRFDRPLLDYPGKPALGRGQSPFVSRSNPARISTSMFLKLAGIPFGPARPLSASASTRRTAATAASLPWRALQKCNRIRVNRAVSGAVEPCDMLTDPQKPVPGLAKGQLWKTDDTYLQIVELGSGRSIQDHE